MTRRYPNARRRRPTTPVMDIKKAEKLAAAGDVDAARALVAAAPSRVVVIEVPVTTATRGRRLR